MNVALTILHSIVLTLGAMTLCLLTMAFVVFIFNWLTTCSDCKKKRVARKAEYEEKR